MLIFTLNPIEQSLRQCAIIIAILQKRGTAYTVPLFYYTLNIFLNACLFTSRLSCARYVVNFMLFGQTCTQFQICHYVISGQFHNNHLDAYCIWGLYICQQNNLTQPNFSKIQGAQAKKVAFPLLVPLATPIFGKRFGCHFLFVIYHVVHSQCCIIISISPSTHTKTDTYLTIIIK